MDRFGPGQAPGQNTRLHRALGCRVLPERRSGTDSSESAGNPERRDLVSGPETQGLDRPRRTSHWSGPRGQLPGNCLAPVELVDPAQVVPDPLSPVNPSSDPRPILSLAPRRQYDAPVTPDQSSLQLEVSSGEPSLRKK